MINTINKEEIIEALYNKFDPDLIAFELDLAADEINKCQEQLKFRLEVKRGIEEGEIEIAIEKINNYIQQTDDRDNIVERYMLIQLSSYINKTYTSKKDLKGIKNETEKLGFSRGIDSLKEILKNLDINIPKTKNSDSRKVDSRENDTKVITETQVPQNYEAMIQKYNKEIEEYNNKIGEYNKSLEQLYNTDVTKSVENLKNQLARKRLLLAFAYFMAGKIEEAKYELIQLIDGTSHRHSAYILLIHIEKTMGESELTKSREQQGKGELQEAKTSSAKALFYYNQAKSWATQASKQYEYDCNKSLEEISKKIKLLEETKIREEK